MNLDIIGEHAHLVRLEPQRPRFERVEAIPAGLIQEIERAVLDFMDSSHLPNGVNRRGFYAQTLQAMASASVLRQGGDLWLGIDEQGLCAYVLGHIGNDYDGILSYTVTQAWVRKDQRGQAWVKWAWDKIRERAKTCFCGHFAILSSREKTKAYCRFLGKGFHPYAEILKEEL